jgi:hypothetical protein
MRGDRHFARNIRGLAAKVGHPESWVVVQMSFRKYVDEVGREWACSCLDGAVIR